MGPDTGDLFVIGWGGTYGWILTAVQRSAAKGVKVAQAHLRYLNPMPRNIGEVSKRRKRILVPELNGGQLCQRCGRSSLWTPCRSRRCRGDPFLVSELESKIEEMTK